MDKQTKEHFRKAFPKIKRLSFPADFDQIDWQDLHVYYFQDTGNDQIFLVTDLRGTLEYFSFETVSDTNQGLALCDITNRMLPRTQVALWVKSRMLKGMLHTVGKYACLDYKNVRDALNPESTTYDAECEPRFLDFLDAFAMVSKR